MSRIRANQITNQSADGAPTVQNGLVISGVTTSTTFSGSGASLTNLPSAQLTGALPALDGSNLTGLSGVSVANQADNRLITATGTTDALNGEAGLTYNTTELAVNGDITLDNGGSAGLNFKRGGVLKADIEIGSSSGELAIRARDSSGFIKFTTGSSDVERLHINSLGGVGIGTNNFSGQLNNEVGLAVHGSSNDNCRISITTPTKSNSRIGYFGLSNRFGIDVHNGFEIRDAEASYATRFKIDNNGYITNNQPYGYVRFNTIADTGGENRQTTVYTHTVENGMSHSSGRLTVPATGKYYIGIHGNLLDDAACAQYLYINGSKQAGWRWQQNDGTQYWKSSMVGGIVGLTANDYLDVYIVGKQDGHSWNMWTVYMKK